ncbi:hypothetical protein N182_20010 [Sinorhizobium sp. GL2]|nr:hypothetical protein N182_20010 [Sinorhizobium sp. GL2]
MFQAGAPRKIVQKNPAGEGGARLAPSWLWDAGKKLHQKTDTRT